MEQLGKWSNPFSISKDHNQKRSSSLFFFWNTTHVAFKIQLDETLLVAHEVYITSSLHDH